MVNVYVRNRPYRGAVQAVVLDWAGTAVDYGCFGPLAAFIEVFKRRGVEVTTAEARAPMGMMKLDHLRAMCRTETVAAKWQAVHGRETDESDVEEMYHETESLMISCLSRHADPIPGLLETVEAFRDRGIRIGSTTGYTRPMMDVLAKAAEEKGYKPDAIISSSEAPAGRPYPWMCYLNAIALRAYPMEAMVKVGDTLADVEEGLNAGMWTVGIAKTGNSVGLSLEEIQALDPRMLEKRLYQVRKHFREAGAHFVVDGIWEVPAIIDRINSRLFHGETPIAFAS